MHKIRAYLNKFLGFTVLIMFLVQAITGIAWFILNFRHAEGSAEGVPFIFLIVLCLLQLAGLFGSCCFLLYRAGLNRRLSLLGGLFVISFPLTLQLSQTVSTMSILAILILLAVGFFIGARNKKEIGAGIILTVLSMLILCSVRIFAVNDFDASVLSRSVTGRLEICYVCAPDEVKECLTDYDFFLGDMTPDGIERNFIPKLEETFGEQKAGEYVKAISAAARVVLKKDIVRYTAADFVGYLFSPVIILMELGGRGGISYTPINYEHFCEFCPVFNAFALRLGMKIYVFGLVAGLTMLVTNHKRLNWRGLGTAFACVAVAACFALRGGCQFDYRETVFINCLWNSCLYLLAVKGAELNDERNSDNS